MRARTARFIAIVLGSFGLAADSIPGALAGAPPVWNREVDGTIFDAFGPVGGAWLGGLDRARPQFVDIDADSDPDLFVAEEDGRLRFYRNDGTAGAPSFRFVTDDYSGKHEFYFTRFVDIDSDGDQDLLVEAPAFEEEGPDGNVALRPGGFLYRNEGTPLEPEWVLDSPRTDGYFADENGLPIGFDTTAPDFVDLDGDGDPDLLMGVATGAIILYRNVGAPTAPVFRYETNSYQDVLIIFGACNPELAEPTTLGDWWRSQGPTPRHGFMLFSFFDVDDDSRPDLFVGDSNNSNVYYFTNVGGSPDPNFQCVSEAFFPDSTGGQGLFSRQLVSAFADLDGDGDADCVVGAGVEVTTPVTLWQFRNDGSPTIPNYRFVTSRYLDEFDLGRRTAPLLVDFEGDGRLDLYVGIESEQHISQYGNIGTASDPQFALFDERWRPMPLTSAITPESADLDSDGDLDLFVGVSSGAVRWFRNEGPPAAPAFVEVTTDSAFGEPSSKRIRRATRQQATPRFLDEDSDGDLDLLVGRWQTGQDGNATILLFRNDGTPTVPDLVLASEDWRGLGPFGRSVAPALGDLDGDSDLDLIVGLADGVVRGYRNVGTPAHAQFVPDGAPALDVGR
ncbi:MAG: VCBS repeat-containing protein, partial [Gemmatimonadetes bacterium]|nr:VCBS repeat-containing protein [Gemmatimonadota bacterium]